MLSSCFVNFNFFSFISKINFLLIKTMFMRLFIISTMRLPNRFGLAEHKGFSLSIEKSKLSMTLVPNLILKAIHYKFPFKDTLWSLHLRFKLIWKSYDFLASDSTSLLTVAFMGEIFAWTVWQDLVMTIRSTIVIS